MASTKGFAVTTFRKHMAMVSSQKVEVMLLILHDLQGVNPVHSDYEPKPGLFQEDSADME
jgi:hypothetical protein